MEGSLMENIIQQIALELAKNILEKGLSEKIHDIDALSSEVLADCKKAATDVIRVILEHLNEQIRRDKSGRKEAGLTLHKRDVPRSLYTSIGELTWERDYYRHGESGSYRYLLDEAVGVIPYQRVGDTVSADLLNRAAMVSYAKSTDIVTGGKISRQTVRNKLLRVKVPEPEVVTEKKRVKELHVYADEDHAHMQRPHKEKGKRSQRIPLVTVSEGTRAKSSSRNELIGAVHFVDEGFDASALWKTVEGYIGKAYDIDCLEKIYVHGDGGGWIQHGLEVFTQTEHVMDGYHFFRDLRAIGKLFPKRNVRHAVVYSLEHNDRIRAGYYIQSLLERATKEEKTRVLEFARKLFRFWEQIRRRVTENIPGSCTEGQISHVLSERVSRDPLGWSKEGLGKLSKVRVSVKNGRPVERKDFKRGSKREPLADYADRIIDDLCRGPWDWSVFEREPFMFDGTSGTQILIKGLGQRRNILN